MELSQRRSWCAQEGVISVQSTTNNTIITLADTQGRAQVGRARRTCSVFLSQGSLEGLASSADSAACFRVASPLNNPTP